MKISVIITVLNEEKTIEALLIALAKQMRVPDEVVIVDGGSTDTTNKKLEEIKKKIVDLHLKLFRQPGNRSVGRNYAIKQASYEWIAITDAGCIPDSRWLEELEKRSLDIARDDNCVVVAGYYDAKPETPFEEAVVPYFLVMPDRVNPDDFLPATRSMMVHRSVWEKVGRFNEGLSDNEDYEFAKRIKKEEERRNKKVIFFTDKAKVTWLPPKTLRQFAKTIFRFARGDAQAGIWRPKVGLIFGRYGLLALLLPQAASRWPLSYTFCFLLFGFLLYSAWSIYKNLRYVPHGWYWLPLLQIVSDVAVMLGTFSGWLASLRYTHLR